MQKCIFIPSWRGQVQVYPLVSKMNTITMITANQSELTYK